jgi:hypothetical protein
MPDGVPVEFKSESSKVPESSGVQITEREGRLKRFKEGLFSRGRHHFRRKSEERDPQSREYKAVLTETETKNRLETVPEPNQPVVENSTPQQASESLTPPEAVRPVEQPQAVVTDDLEGKAGPKGANLTEEQRARRLEEILQTITPEDIQVVPGAPINSTEEILVNPEEIPLLIEQEEDKYRVNTPLEERRATSRVINSLSELELEEALLTGVFKGFPVLGEDTFGGKRVIVLDVNGEKVRLGIDFGDQIEGRMGRPPRRPRGGGVPGVGAPIERNQFYIEDGAIPGPPGDVDPLGNPNRYAIPTEWGYISHPTYGVIEVVVPKNPEDKWKYINNALTELEQSTSEAAEGAAGETLQRAQTMISALLNERYKREHRADPNNEVGIRLLHEFIARQKLHQVTRAIEVGESLENVAKLIQNIKGDMLNSLLHNARGLHNGSEVARAMAYYDKHAERFMAARGDLQGRVAEDQLAQFRLEARRFAAGRDPGNTADTAEETIWAQSIAERILTMTLRLSRRDRTGKGLNTGGYYFLDRLANFDRWSFANAEDQGLFPELIFPVDPRPGHDKENHKRHHEGYVEVDLGVRDYWSKRFIDNIYRNLKQRVRYQENREPNPTELEAVALEVERLTGVSGRLKENGDYDFTPENPHDIIIDFDYMIDKWDDINFAVVGGERGTASPLTDYAIYELDQPDRVRAALVDPKSGYLRNPTTEAVMGLKQLLPYLGGDQEEFMENALENWLIFATTERHERTGKPHYHYNDIQGVLNQAAGLKDADDPAVIKVETYNRLHKKLKSRYPWYKRLAEDLKVRFGGNFILGFIIGVIEEFFDELEDIGKGK